MMSAAALCAAVFVSCNAGTRSKATTPSYYRVKVEQVLPHDRDIYTQGLFFDGGVLYESAGQYGRSCVRTVDLQTGASILRTDMDKQYFGEGSCILDGKMYVLTWLEKKVFTYDPRTLEQTGSFHWPCEGWGLTTDGRRLYATDGSDRLYVVNPDGLEFEKTVRVTYNGKKLSYLNELEWIDGRIWANVYGDNHIVIINPSTGVVEGVVDCTGILPDKLRDADTDVLNGIAYNPADGRIYITGKNWPRMYGISLTEVKL